MFQTKRKQYMSHLYYKSNNMQQHGVKLHTFGSERNVLLTVVRTK